MQIDHAIGFVEQCLDDGIGDLVRQKPTSGAGEHAIQVEVVGAYPRTGFECEGICRRAQYDAALEALVIREAPRKLPQCGGREGFVTEDARHERCYRPRCVTFNHDEPDTPGRAVSAAPDVYVMRCQVRHRRSTG